MKNNDEVVENICVLFSELVEYGKSRCVNLQRIVNLPSNNLILVILPEDIKDEMKLNANITKLLSEAKTNFSDDEHEVKALMTVYFAYCTKTHCVDMWFTVSAVSYT